jgi:hypothetical protein
MLNGTLAEDPEKNSVVHFTSILGVVWPAWTMNLFPPLEPVSENPKARLSDAALVALVPWLLITTQRVT